MLINGVELEDLDLMDADTADNLEKVVDKLNVLKDQNNFKNMSFGDVIRKQCSIVFDVFNILWGEGTDKKVFGSKTNLRECTNALEPIVNLMEQTTKEIKSFNNRYSSNRAERRNNTYKGNKRR